MTNSQIGTHNTRIEDNSQITMSNNVMKNDKHPDWHNQAGKQTDYNKNNPKVKIQRAVRIGHLTSLHKQTLKK